MRYVLTGMSALLAGALLSGQPACAADPGWYAGVNGGQSEATIDNDRISDELRGDGLSIRSIHDDDRDAGFKLFGGYQFNRYFAVEGGYFDLGKFGFKADTLPPGTLSGDTRLRGLNLDAVGTVPLIYDLSAFARIGVNVTQASDSFSGGGAVDVTNPSPSRRATNFKVGAGLEYPLTRAIGLRFEVERYRVDDGIGNKGDIDLVSFGLLYRFGSSGPAPERVAEIPAPTPPPAPEIAPAAPSPVAIVPSSPKTSVLSADALFDFDGANVKPAGQASLDRFAASLKGTSYSLITISGYTDRLGPAGYNQRLSARRADAVKAYLEKSAGIPPERMVARGMDGSNPVTSADQCQGTRPTKSLIDCLQPDRRVQIEVSVTQ